MKKIRLIDSNTLLKKQMKEASFRKAYDDLEDEFALAKEFLRLRIRAKMTQRELAKKAGTSQPAIARLESGEYRNVSLSFLRKISKPLGAVPEVHLKHCAS